MKAINVWHISLIKFSGCSSSMGRARERRGHDRMSTLLHAWRLYDLPRFAHDFGNFSNWRNFEDYKGEKTIKGDFYYHFWRYSPRV
ncbi:hypothetical protein POVWA2_015210 [Plasmodium ovale wallikeri]|uniref:Uncharacterized protein n=1 Tax=Plasmodium ovale wallikeri TaxID=864142 RepID=A0A1A8YSD2_PLAOA|nr:hypothetical protein POVWA2_015210 [Plasmodium ovale wallikeri]SBT34347.1 hypothetical protein POVWA1_021820 [Plasmodium ovale wallikeri]